MKTCPNVSSKEWKDLVSNIGQFEAMRDFIEYGTVRSIDEVRESKPEIFPKKPNNDLDAVLLDFVKGLNITVEENADSVLKELNLLAGNPLGAFDMLQKYLAVASTKEFDTVPELVANITYAFLGQKSTLSNALWHNIDKWKKYDEIYNHYHNLKINDQNERIDDDTRNSWAHKQVIIQFIKEGLISNFNNKDFVIEEFPNRDVDKTYFAEKGFLNPFEENTLKSVWNRLLNWIKENILGVKKYEEFSAERLQNLLLDIVDDVYSKDYSKFIRGVYEQDGKLYKADGTELELKDYNKTLEKDLFAKQLISKLVSNPYVNFKLSGSQVIRKYGTLYRNVDEDLHDIDGVITLETFKGEQNSDEFLDWIKKRGIMLSQSNQRQQFIKEITPFLEDQAWYKNVKDMFPSWELAAAFIGKDHKNGESVTITGFVEHPTETEVVTESDLKGRSKSDIGKVKPKRYTLDFFLRTDKGSYPEIFDNYWKDWKQIFEAKIKMGRSKDLADLIYFDPFIKDKYKFTNRGYRYFSFATTDKKVENDFSAFYRDLTQYQNRYSAVYDPITLSENENNKTRGNEIAVKLANRISSNTGVPVQIISAEEASRILSGSDIPYGGEAGFYFGNTVYLVAEKMTTEVVFHEFAHPIVRAILKNNPELGRKLYNDLIATKEGEVLKNLVARAYPELEETDPLFIEEVIVRALSMKADAINNNKELSTGFISIINKILFAIKQAFRELFKGNRIKVETLDVNTTLDQLADMLANKEFTITTERVSENDVAAFSRDLKQEMTKTLQEIDNSDLVASSKKFFDVISRQIGVTGNFNYAELRGILSDAMDRSDLREMTGNLKYFQNEIDREFATDKEELEYVRAHAEALLNSILRLEQASKRMLEHFKDLSEDTDNKENLNKIFYYDKLLRDWERLVLEMRDRLLSTRNSNGEMFIQSDNPLLQKLDSIRTLIEQTKKYREKVYTDGVVETITETLSTLRDNIDNMYKTILEDLDKKGASDTVKSYWRREYEELKITPERIKALLRGELGDAHALNSFLEGYMNNQDPVIFGFASYVKDQYMGLNSRVQERYTKLLIETEDLLNKAGYTTGISRMKMGDDLLFLDKRYFKDGNEKEVYSFLNPWQDYKVDEQKLQDEVDKAQRAYLENKTKETEEEYAAALAKQRDWYSTYMHQEYTSAYYAIFDIFKDAPDAKVKIGALADRKRREILNEIQAKNTALTSVDQLIKNAEDTKQLWRRYKQLFSLNNADGTPKIDDYENGIYDLSIAKKLQEYKEKSREIYEWKVRKGAFENAYMAFLQQMRDTGVKENGPEWKAKREKWLQENGRVEYSEEYYKRRQEIFTELAELSKSDPDAKRIADLNLQIVELLYPYRDDNGQPLGSDMDTKLLDKIKSIEEEIEELYKDIKGDSGLSANDLARYSYLGQKLKAREELTDDELDEYDTYKQTLDKNKSKKMSRKQELLMELREIQLRVPSQDYYDTVNELLNDENRELLLDDTGQNLFDPKNSNFLENYNFMQKLFSTNPKLKTWFENNHIVKERKEKKKKKKKKVYKPTRAWTYNQPRSVDYLKKTEIKDENGNIIEELPYVPALHYFTRRVKNDPKYITPKITMLDCLREGRPLTDATVDMRGNFLPKFEASQKYLNNKYFDLQKQSPEKFELLHKLLEFHLENQEKLPRNSRLDVEQPRYRKDNVEASLSFSTENIKQNPISIYAGKIKSFFSRAKDDFEEGLNAEQDHLLVSMDLFDDTTARIPITGMYDIEPEQVSMDMLRSIMRYAQSGMKQEVLLKMLPTARALQAILQDPDNNPDEEINNMKLYNKTTYQLTGILSPKKVKGQSIRSAAIDAFIAREFEGQTQAGLLTNSKGINKLVNAMFRFSSTSFFAFNIPSALKNSFGARFQSMIEAAGGKYFNVKDYMEGTAWANKATAEISMEIYRFGPKSLDVQMIELFDPSQGRLQTKIAEGTNLSRSLVTDTMGFQYLTNVRKWTELNTTISVFGAMAKKQKVEMTLSDGSKTEISLRDAYEIKNGIITLKEGVDPEWNKDGKKFKSFVKKVHGVVNNINGAYASFDQPDANRYLLYRFIMWLKTYFTRMFMNRWQARWDPQTKSFRPRYDANLDELTMGYYVESFNFLYNLIRVKGNRAIYATDSQKRALKKMLMEVMLLALLSEMMLYMIFGFDPDDEDRYEKLRQKSGSMPFLFAPEDAAHPFNLTGYMSNHMLNLASQVRGENEAWIPLPGFGVDDYLNILKFESLAIKRTFDTYADIFKGIGGFIAGDEYAVYQRDVGPYAWQQQGGAKFLNYLAKSLSFTGTTLSPEMALRNWYSYYNK